MQKAMAPDVQGVSKYSIYFWSSKHNY